MEILHEPEPSEIARPMSTSEQIEHYSAEELFSHQPRRKLSINSLKERRTKKRDRRMYLSMVCLMIGAIMVLNTSMRLCAYFYIPAAVVGLNFSYARLKKQKRQRELWDIGTVMHLALGIALASKLVTAVPEDLLRGLYVVCTGPVVVKIATNNLMPIFHSAEQFFAYYFHAFPVAVLFRMRWDENPPEYSLSAIKVSTESFINCTGYVSGLYFVWVIFYGLTRLVNRPKPQKKRHTSDAVQEQREPNSKGTQTTGLLLKNLMLTVALAPVSLVCYWNPYINAIWTFGILLLGVYRAGDYYIYDFPVNYHKNILVKQDTDHYKME